MGADEELSIRYPRHIASAQS